MGIPAESEEGPTYGETGAPESHLSEESMEESEKRNTPENLAPFEEGSEGAEDTS